MPRPGTLPFISTLHPRGRHAPTTSMCVKRSGRASRSGWILRCIPRPLAAAELGVKPRPGIIPVASRGCTRDAEGPASLLDRQAGEVAELHQLGLDRVFPGEPG